MSRTANLDSAAILDKAMHFFWKNGFNAASIDALIQETGTTRFSLYQLFKDKEGLYAAALDHYSETVVTQALAHLNPPNSGLQAVKKYFDFLIKTAHKNDCISRGCLMANTMVEFGNGASDIAAKANEHFDRIATAVLRALMNGEGALKPSKQSEQCARYLAIFAQGLWLRARAGDDAASLRRAYSSVISSLEK